MSRRYGRNQKRRARVQIAALMARSQELYVRQMESQRTIQKLSSTIIAKEAELAHVAKALGVHFIGLKPKLREYEAWMRDQFLFREPSGDVTMHMLKTNIVSAPDRPNYMVHFRVKMADEEVGYAISECTLRDTDEQFLVRQIAGEMAELLIRELRMKWAGR